MVLHLPNFDTLRLALTSGAVPAAVSLAPVAAAFREDGIWLQPSAPLPRAALGRLGRLGIETAKGLETSVLEEYQCWPQLLPLERSEAMAAITSQTPVLFELQPASLLTEVAGEIL